MTKTPKDEKFGVRCDLLRQLARESNIGDSEIAQFAGVKQPTVTLLLSNHRGSQALLDKLETAVGSLAAKKFVGFFELLSAATMATHSGAGASFTKTYETELKSSLVRLQEEAVTHG